MEWECQKISSSLAVISQFYFQCQNNLNNNIIIILIIILIILRYLLLPLFLRPGSSWAKDQLHHHHYHLNWLKDKSKRSVPKYFFSWRVRPETSVTFILCGTGIFLVLFYIYPIVPYASALCAQFLLFF